MLQKDHSLNFQDELWIFCDVWIILFVHFINWHDYCEGSKKNTIFCIIRNKIYLETHELRNYRKCICICQLATHDMSIVLYIHPISTHYLRRERISEMIIRWCWNGMSKVISLIYIRISVILETIYMFYDIRY